MMKRLMFSAGISLLAVMHPAWAADVLTGARLYDGTGAPPVDQAVIRIESDRITCVGSANDCAVEEGDSIIDLTGQFITPGLIDGHVHFSQTGWLDGRPHWPYLQEHYDYEALQASLKANPDRWHRAYLCSGITGVYDPGGLPWSLEVEAAASGHPGRVHYRAAGPLITHASVAVLKALDTDTFLPMGDEDEVREGVRFLVENGARAVKVWYLDPPAERRETLDSLLLLAGDVARKAGLPLIVHATELRNAKMALRAGAALLVHSVEDDLVDAEFIELARTAGTVYSPTLQVGGNWRQAISSVDLGVAIEPDDPNGCIDAETRRVVAEAPILRDLAHETPPAANAAFGRIEDAGRTLEIMMRNLKTVVEAGIPVVTSTDAGNPLTFHGPSIYREMELMEAAGISATQIIPMSTRNGARLMGLADETGTLEAGKLADLIVLSEDPGESARAFRSVHHVMHLGRYHAVTDLGGTP